MQDLFLQKLSEGLKKQSTKKCSKWAENYRIIKGKKWTFKNHPWLKEMHDSDNELVIGQKAAQMGYTEYALNRTFYKIDIEQADSLYVLPTESDASDFSSGRFDTALDECEHLRSIFSNVNNVALKRAGSSVLYVRGSKSRSKLKSIPTGFIVLDELEEMPAESISLALERSSGQKVKQHLLISTPVIFDKGINKYYQDSTREIFYFKCPSCSKYVDLSFPDSVIITADHLNDPRIKETHYICKECKNELPHEDKSSWLSTGKFEAQNKQGTGRGFTVSQLYSPTILPRDFAAAYFRAQNDPTDEQEFYNSKLGTPHVVSGSSVDGADIEECIESYNQQNVRCKSPIITMGIDVGKFWHYVIEEWYVEDRTATYLELNEKSIPRLIRQDKIPLHNGKKEIIDLILKYNVSSFVIDRHPETVTSTEIIKRFWGKGHLCIFSGSVNAKRIQNSENEDKLILVDRTSWFDLALYRFKQRRIILPNDLDQEFINHLQAPVRIYKRDGNNNPIGRWDSRDKPDHYALSRVYSEIALQQATSSNDVINIT